MALVQHHLWPAIPLYPLHFKCSLARARPLFSSTVFDGLLSRVKNFHKIHIDHFSFSVNSRSSSINRFEFCHYAVAWWEDKRDQMVMSLCSPYILQWFSTILWGGGEILQILTDNKKWTNSWICSLVFSYSVDREISYVKFSN